jgi:hypothetical protein
MFREWLGTLHFNRRYGFVAICDRASAKTR